mmetsp:Transcript_5086/g.7728  ORF Transcript_5086/g.7728 Transcript_5086/m.7728 type:complete len:102 (+) Transcript_5086:561-866(+)
MGFDPEGVSDGYSGRDNSDDVQKKSKTCIQNLIVIPSESAWLGFWKFIVFFSLFWGYFTDPYHIAFVKSQNPPELSLSGNDTASIEDEPVYASEEDSMQSY